MRLDPDVSKGNNGNGRHISSNAAAVVGKAAEMFLTEMCSKVCVREGEGENVGYEDVKNCVEKEERMGFLRPVFP
jgi:hypothetical protein